MAISSTDSFRFVLLILVPFLPGQALEATICLMISGKFHQEFSIEGIA